MELTKERVITYNAIQCRHCGHILESKHRHDYRTHTCHGAPPEAWHTEREWVNGVLVETGKKIPPSITVDGGLEYLCCGGNPEDYRMLPWEGGA